MSGGYTKEEVVANIRKTRSLDELHDLAYNSKGQIHKYAQVEAQRELRARLAGRKRKQRAKDILSGYNLGLKGMDSKMKKLLKGSLY